MMIRMITCAGLVATATLASGCSTAREWDPISENHPASPHAQTANVAQPRTALDADSHQAFVSEDEAVREHDHPADAHDHSQHDEPADDEHGHQHHHDHADDDVDGVTIEHGPDADYSRYCFVSGEPLGEFGEPAVLEHDGGFYLVCCQGCERDFRRDPETYLDRLRGSSEVDDHQHENSDVHSHDH